MQEKNLISKISIKYFTTEGCNVCKVLLPKIKILIKKNYSSIKLEVLNIKKKTLVAADNQVFTIPVLIIYFEKKEYSRFVRVFSLAEIKEKLERLIERIS